MAIRKLRTRKKVFSKGKVIRVSDEVYEQLDARRNKPNGKRFSWDALMRKFLGLPDRKGNDQNLIEGVLEAVTGKMFLRVPVERGPRKLKTWSECETEAYEYTIRAVAAGKAKEIVRPVRMREIP